MDHCRVSQRSLPGTACSWQSDFYCVTNIAFGDGLACTLFFLLVCDFIFSAEISRHWALQGYMDSKE
ncbi:hypothetical protein VTL71DRAFT_15322 [Oculimacula yallundae]|uniref:Uncharacterized protein n=1 Tax=Oculimacula yallundae TaxID=86028 RepID=A0ABR4CGV8_9HELO